MTDSLIIPLKGLLSGRNCFSMKVDGTLLDSFENQDISDVNLEVGVVLNKVSDAVKAEIQIKGKIVVPCNRCMGEKVLQIKQNIVADVKFSAAGEKEDSDAEVLYADDDNVDLSQIVYDYIVLSIPAVNVHENGECGEEVMRYLKSDSCEDIKNTPFDKLKTLLADNN